MSGSVPATAGRWWAGLRWYLRAVSGETAYERYVARERADRPGAPVLDRRTFERRRQDERGARPQQRCC